MLEEQKGVVVAMPFAAEGRVEVWATKPGALTEDEFAIIKDHPA